MALENGNIGFGGDGWWIVLLFFLMAGNGWGYGGNAADATAQRGFDQASVMNGFTGVNAAIGNLSTQLYNTQMNDMQNAFAMQQSFSQCCCDNRLATAQTQSIVQQEGAATRLAIQQQTQAILDKMCQQEIDNLKAQNVALQNQVNMLNLAASQTAQTAALVADNSAQTQYLLSKLSPTTAAAG